MCPGDRSWLDPEWLVKNTTFQNYPSLLNAQQELSYLTDFQQYTVRSVTSLLALGVVVFILRSRLCRDPLP